MADRRPVAAPRNNMAPAPSGLGMVTPIPALLSQEEKIDQAINSTTPSDVVVTGLGAGGPAPQRTPLPPNGMSPAQFAASIRPTQVVPGGGSRPAPAPAVATGLGAPGADPVREPLYAGAPYPGFGADPSSSEPRTRGLNLGKVARDIELTEDDIEPLEAQGQPSNEEATDQVGLKNVPAESFEFMELHEGERPDAYVDSEGFATIGVGHKLTVDDLRAEGYDMDKYLKGTTAKEAIKNALEDRPLTWDAQKIQDTFNADMAKAGRAAIDVLQEWGINRHDLTQAQLTGLISMAYQMGKKGLAGFKKMLGALAEGKVARASDEVMDSKFASQTPERAEAVAELIRRA